MPEGDHEHLLTEQLAAALASATTLEQLLEAIDDEAAAGAWPARLTAAR